MTRIIMAIAIVIALTAATEPGATFDEGTCWEADGTQGAAMPDGQCVTPADYDAMFSVENLSTIPSITNPDLAVAEEANLVDDGPASERVNGAGLVDEPESFVQYVARLHQPKAI